MKQKNKIPMILNCLGVLIFIAMGLGLTERHNNVTIFLGIACFIISGLVHKMCSDNCQKDKDN